MYAKQTLRWIELLPYVTRSYNLRPKASLGNLSPEQAKQPQNIEFVKNLLHQKKLAYEKKFDHQKVKFSLGDLVKIVKIKNPFSRGYTQKVDDKTFRISKIHETKPVTFSLNGSPKTFYSEQLVRVPERPSNEYYIAETKQLPETFLRSGKVLTYKNLTLIKDKLNPRYSEWKTDAEIQKMRRDGALPENEPSQLIRPN